MLFIDRFTLEQVMRHIIDGATCLTDEGGKRAIVKTIEAGTLRSVALAALSVSTGQSVVELK
jgi:hypothetical protein